MHSENLAKKNVRKELEKSWFHVVLLVSISVPIIALMLLDYLNIESFSIFNQEFRFLFTWKGRMFYLFFLWLLFLESLIDWNQIIEKKPKSRLRIIAFLICATIPLIYILSVNFWGLNHSIIGLGQNLGFTNYSLEFHWPLAVEYLVFAISFLAAILLAYKKDGLNFFSIALTLLLGMSIIYTIDAFYPGGTFKPFEMLALPTAACAAAVLDILGYNFALYFHSGAGAMPRITLFEQGKAWGVGADIGWPCAGVQSLFLFTIIILLFFKRSNISSFRKLIYFIVGAFGTFFVNVLRIVSYFVILRDYGEGSAAFFHNNVGELYFIVWMSIYILIIILIQRFGLVEKTRYSVQKLLTFLVKKKDSKDVKIA